jgi:cell division protein FtsQ
MDSQRSPNDRVHYFSKLSFLILLAVILSARAVWLFLSDTQRFPIQTVHIEASYQHLSHKQLQSILEPYVQHSFFTIPMRKLTHDFNAIDRIKRVRIEREWPSTLIIFLEEKQAIARWNQMLLTDNGQTFTPLDADEASELPQLLGPDAMRNEVLAQYKKMSKILSANGLSASMIRLRNNFAWEVTLREGVLLRLGKVDVNKRLQRFSTHYSSLSGKKSALLKSVDLRYPKGMAVEWKSET